MATYLQNLTTTRANVAAILADITANPKPTYSIDGESVSWESYLSMLLDKLKVLDESIQRAQAPFSRVSRGRA